MNSILGNTNSFEIGASEMDQKSVLLGHTKDLFMLLFLSSIQHLKTFEKNVISINRFEKNYNYVELRDQ